jgi:hypothetical protein
VRHHPADVSFEGVLITGERPNEAAVDIIAKVFAGLQLIEEALARLFWDQFLNVASIH